MALVLLVVSMLSATEGVDGAAARERWRRPLPGGAVAGSFAFDRAAPYEHGRRRGIDIRARPGARVLAACSGVVTHAGRVPRWSRGVTLRCGDGLVATELGLVSVAVARDGWVVAGATVGRLASRGVLRLSARVAGRRHGYVDPAALLGDGEGDPAWPAVAPPPRAAARLPRGTVTAPRVAAQPVATPAPPWPVPAGLALLATAATTTRTARGRRRRRVPAEALAVQR
jgi:hypothetical protein